MLAVGPPHAEVPPQPRNTGLTAAGAGLEDEGWLLQADRAQSLDLEVVI